MNHKRYDEAVQNLNHEKYLLNQLKRRSINLFENNTETEYFISNNHNNNNNTLHLPQDNEIYYDCSEEDININQVEALLERKLSKKSRKSCLSITDSDLSHNNNKENNENNDINNLNISSPSISPEKDSIKSSLSSTSSNSHSPSKTSSNRNSWYNNNNNKRLSTVSLKELSTELKRISKNESDPTFLSTSGYTNIEQQAYKELNNNGGAFIENSNNDHIPFPSTNENYKSNIEPQDSPYTNEFQLRRSKNTFKSRKPSVTSSSSSTPNESNKLPMQLHPANNNKLPPTTLSKKPEVTLPTIPNTSSKQNRDPNSAQFHYDQRHYKNNEQMPRQQYQHIQHNQQHLQQQQQQQQHRPSQQHPQVYPSQRQVKLQQHLQNHHYSQQQQQNNIKQRHSPKQQHSQALPTRQHSNSQYPQIYPQQQKYPSHRHQVPYQQQHVPSNKHHHRPEQPSNEFIHQQQQQQHQKGPMHVKQSQKRIPSASNTNINDFMIQTPTTKSKHRHRHQKVEPEPIQKTYPQQRSQPQQYIRQQTPQHYNYNNGIPHRSQQLHQNLDLLRSEINEFKESLSRSTDDRPVMTNDQHHQKSLHLDQTKEPSPPKNLSNSDISFDVSYQDLSTDDPLGMEKEISRSSTSPPIFNNQDSEKVNNEENITNNKQSTPETSPKKEFRIGVPLHQSPSPEKEKISPIEDSEDAFVLHSTPQVSPVKAKIKSPSPPHIVSPEKKEILEEPEIKQSTPEAIANPLDEVDDIFANIPTVDNDFLDLNDDEDEDENHYTEKVQIIRENDLEISPKFQASPKYENIELSDDDDQFEKSNSSRRLLFLQQQNESTNSSIKTTSKATKVNTKLFNKGSVQIIDSNNYEEKMGLKKHKKQNSQEDKSLKKKKSFGILSTSLSPSISENIDDKKILKKKKSWNWLRERSSSLSSMDSNSSSLNNQIQPSNNQSKPIRSFSNPETSSSSNNEDSTGSDKENAFSRLFKKKSKINLNHNDKLRNSTDSENSNSGVTLVEEKIPTIKKKSSGLFKKRSKAKLNETVTDNKHDQKTERNIEQKTEPETTEKKELSSIPMEVSTKIHSASKLNNHIDSNELDIDNDLLDNDEILDKNVDLEENTIPTPIEKDVEPTIDSLEKEEITNDQVSINEVKLDSLKKNKKNRLKRNKLQKESENNEPSIQIKSRTSKEEELNQIESTSKQEETEPSTTEVDSKNKLDIQEKLKKQIKRTSKANQPIEFSDSAFGFPLPPPSQSTIIMLDYRFPVHVERAIYRLSHLKLANPKRSLREQVLLSNFMYSYLNLIDHTLHIEQMENKEEEEEDQGDKENNNSDNDDDEKPIHNREKLDNNDENLELEEEIIIPKTSLEINENDDIEDNNEDIQEFEQFVEEEDIDYYDNDDNEIEDDYEDDEEDDYDDDDDLEVDNHKKLKNSVIVIGGNLNDKPERNKRRIKRNRGTNINGSSNTGFSSKNIVNRNYNDSRIIA
ncbi:ZDS1 [Candida pseudojiufengensis]|uniref:ZDS1 n=1 Tax=Candida pseudojiufengensis TaxID=497109 RepID=UPI002225AD32|nr:ZDS1 [Candida pseudojiufengensis]KAI5965922.1 ZDS1 [Candida pseudojiufengensis]